MANRRIRPGTLVLLTYTTEIRYPSTVEAHGVIWLVDSDISKQYYVLKSLSTGCKVSFRRRDFVRSDNKGTRLGQRP